MSYTPTKWNNGDVITAEKLNKLEQGVENEQVGPQGPKGDTGAKGDKGDTGAAGADGKSITAIKLTTTEGAVTSGEATLSDGSKITIIVSKEGT